MRRLIASSLLLFALFGTVLPLAQAITGTPLHACCLRKGVHQCHEVDGESSSQPIVHDASCCQGDCARAVTTAQWAQAQPRPVLFSLPALSLQLSSSFFRSPVSAFTGVRSSRAPPLA
jgi:hypothetical protein